MESLKRFLRTYAKSMVAILLIGGAYSFARIPALSSTERAYLASQFSFAKSQLPEIEGHQKKTIRAVHPSLEVISAWISTVGAAVALNDLDGDGLHNDAFYVDTRINQAIVAPAPSTGARFEPFTLNPAPLHYDPETMAPMGCLPGDFNEDGLIDVLVYYWGRTPVMFLRNGAAPLSNPERLFTRAELVSGSERWFTNAATQADLDGDGHVDLIIGNYFPDGARILDAKGAGTESMQRSMSHALNGGRNRLLLWNGLNAGASDGAAIPSFTSADGALTDDLSRGWTLAVGAADLDGDLLPELYFANDFGPDRLLHNRSTPGRLRFELLKGERTITVPKSKVLGRDSFKGMGVDFGDVNGDGLIDIYVSNIAAEYALEESHFMWVGTGQIERMKDGVAPFADHSEGLGLSRSGWGWEARLADFNNDGVVEALQATGFLKGEVNRWPDLHELAMGNDQLLHIPGSWPRIQPGDSLSGNDHSPFFVRARNGRFYDLAGELGMGEQRVSRGIAIADVDKDGRLDFAVANQWDSSIFYRNVSPEPGTFLGLDLLLPIDKAASPQGRGVGRPAIGASATVRLPDGRRLVAQVDGGSGHSGKRSPALHFGLGHLSPDTKLEVELRWRDSGGRASQRTFYLSPGWHTVLLGS
ncbi:MAG TPA: CRTAC1 family protein [Blastocatellia bacterium]|nr:CRTAC1 family protein [Blastocatellia bacterium]